MLRPFFGYARCVYKAEDAELRRVCRSMHQVCEERFDDVVRQGCAAGSPIMLVHESDGYSCDMMKTISTSMVDGSLQRVGRYRQEWLLELLVVKTYDGRGHMQQAIRFFAPRVVEGKTGWHIFLSSLQVPSLMNMRQCDDIIKIEVFIQDGLHSAGMLKKQVALRSLFYEAPSVRTPGECSGASGLVLPQLVVILQSFRFRIWRGGG